MADLAQLRIIRCPRAGETGRYGGHQDHRVTASQKVAGTRPPPCFCFQAGNKTFYSLLVLARQICQDGRKCPRVLRCPNSPISVRKQGFQSPRPPPQQDTRNARFTDGKRGKRNRARRFLTSCERSRAAKKPLSREPSRSSIFLQA